MKTKEKVKNEVKNERNSTIELLRILCMLMIILHHSYAHSNIKMQLNYTNYILFSILSLLGELTTNIFVIITGYYMVNKKINTKSILKLILETWFYSYTILILYIIFSPNKKKSIILNLCMPITSNLNWFVTSYIILYLGIPFINTLLANLNKKQFQHLIVYFLIILSILPTIYILKDFSSALWFVCLYCVGAYINLNKASIRQKENYIILFCSSMALIVIFLLEKHFGIFFIDLGNRLNFFSFLISLSTFIVFINLKTFQNVIINNIAKSVLGIYLLHDNIVVRDFIWKKIGIEKMVSNKTFWLDEFFIILTIFFICLIIDKLRKNLLEKPLFILVDRLKRRNK